jgi:hypothetical protein
LKFSLSNVFFDTWQRSSVKKTLGKEASLPSVKIKHLANHLTFGEEPNSGSVPTKFEDFYEI